MSTVIFTGTNTTHVFEETELEAIINEFAHWLVCWLTDFV